MPGGLTEKEIPVPALMWLSLADTILGRMASHRRTVLLETNRRPPEETGIRSTETERMDLPGARLGIGVSGLQLWGMNRVL